MENSSILKGIISFIIVIAIAYGAYFFLTNDLSFFKKEDNPSNKNVSSETKEITNPEIKKDKDKDLIYFETVEVVNIELNLIYKYPIINIDSEEVDSINTNLKNKLKDIKNSVVYAELPEEKDLCEENIKEAKEINYEIYEYKNYITLVVLEGTYSCLKEGSENIISSYTFDVTTGKKISENEIFNNYNTSLNNIKNKIKNLLNERLIEIVKNDDSLSDFIDITGTINNLKTNETFIAYINNKGKLEINFVVITKHVNYNEIMIIE